MDRQETNRSINSPVLHLADKREQILATIGGSQEQQYHAEKGSGISPGDIIEIILRRRWIIIIPFVFTMLVGCLLVLYLPKAYRSSTMILVQPQKVPTDYVRSLVSGDIDNRINTISQQIMSRTNLMKIIEDFDLFAASKYKDMYREDKINQMRARINVKLIQEDRRNPADAFSISFIGPDPEKVMRVTNALATYFIDENLKLRESQAVGTSDFLNNELADTRKRLMELEELLKAYREEYMGGLPEQLVSNLAILENRQMQLNAIQKNLMEAKVRLSTVEFNIEQEAASRINAAASQINAAGNQVGMDATLDPEQLKVMLKDLRTRYTEHHPGVIRLKKKIADLESVNNQAPTDAADGSETTESVGATPVTTVSVANRDAILSEIRNMKVSMAKLQGEISLYQKRVEDTPHREQELLTLNRDYDNIKVSYDSLLARKLEADLAVNMERKQQGEQFRVLDRADIAQKPHKPDMKKLFMLVLAVGLGLGGGVVFLLEWMDSSVRKPETLEAALGIRVVATLPTVTRLKDRIRSWINQITSVVALSIGVLLLLGFAGLIHTVGDDQMAADIKQNIERHVSSLGIFNFFDPNSTTSPDPNATLPEHRTTNPEDDEAAQGDTVPNINASEENKSTEDPAIDPSTHKRPKDGQDS